MACPKDVCDVLLCLHHFVCIYAGQERLPGDGPRERQDLRQLGIKNDRNRSSEHAIVEGMPQLQTN